MCAEPGWTRAHGGTVPSGGRRHQQVRSWPGNVFLVQQSLRAHRRFIFQLYPDTFIIISYNKHKKPPEVLAGPSESHGSISTERCFFEVRMGPDSLMSLPTFHVRGLTHVHLLGFTHLRRASPRQFVNHSPTTFCGPSFSLGTQ